MDKAKRIASGMLLAALLALAAGAVEAGPPARMNGRGAVARPGLIIVVCEGDRAARSQAGRSGAQSAGAPRNGFFDIFTEVARPPRRPGAMADGSVRGVQGR